MELSEIEADEEELFRFRYQKDDCFLANARKEMQRDKEVSHESCQEKWLGIKICK